MDAPPSPAPLPRVRAALVLVVALALSAVYYRLTWADASSFSLALDKGRTLFGDFRHHYYPTGRSLLAGGGPTDWFLYPLTAATGFAALAGLPAETAFVCWGALQLAFAIALYAITADALRSRPRAFYAHAVLLPLAVPTLHNFKWGQLSTPLVLCVLGALFAAERGRRNTAAALLGLATTIKPFFALFALLFALRRAWDVVARWALFTALFLIAPVVFVGPSRAWSFSVAVAHNIARSRATWVPRDINSQYAANVMLRNLGEDPLTSALRTPLQLVGYVVALGTAAIVWRARERPEARDLRWQTVGLFLTLPWFMETTWPHYFASLAFCQAFALDDALERPRRPASLALVIASAVASSLPLFNLFSSWRPYSSYGVLFASNLALWTWFVLRFARG